MMTEISSGVASAQINSLGAELMSLKDGANTEYLWQGDPRYWSGRSPVLFPVVGRLRDGKYSYNGQEYTMGNHGFARTSEFRLAAHEENHASFELESNEETLKCYPFKFRFTVDYLLEGPSLSIKFTVKNTASSGEMLFCIGAHPGFNVPLLPGERFEDYIIEFEKEENLRTRLVDGNVFFTGETKQLMFNERTIPMTHALFDGDAIVPVELNSASAALKSRKTGRGMKIDYSGFKYLAFWSMKGDSPFVCLEPWIGMGTDSVGSKELKDKRDIITLPAQGTFSVAYTVSLL